MATQKVEELLREIERLTEQERLELIEELRQKYQAVFRVGENYGFWFTGEDDVYDRLSPR